MKFRVTLYDEGEHVFTVKAKNSEDVNLFIDMIFDSKHEAKIERMSEKTKKSRAFVSKL